MDSSHSNYALMCLLSHVSSVVLINASVEGRGYHECPLLELLQGMKKMILTLTCQGRKTASLWVDGNHSKY